MTQGAQPAPRTQANLVPLEEERAVVDRLHAGDRAAFATLYGWYGELVWRQAIIPRLPIRELAEDVLRDTFRTALEKIETFTLVDRSIYFWLHRIAVNKAMDAHRRHTRDRKLQDAITSEPEASILPTQPAAPDAGLKQEELARMVSVSLSRLNERYATALRMRLLEDRSREECAEHFDVKVGTFDVLLHRAIKAFRKEYPP